MLLFATLSTALGVRISLHEKTLKLSNGPIGQKAFVGYFGSVDQDTWKENDATELLGGYKGKLDVLIDVGTGDKFYKQGQLLPENFDETAAYLGIRGPHYKVRFQEVSTLI